MNMMITVVGGCSDPTDKNCDTCCGGPVAKLPFGTGSYVSAVCWFTVRDLADMLGGKVPVGGIDQSYGGTSIQFWMGASSIAESQAPVATQCCGQNGGASCLYNTQIHPYTLGPMQFAAALFYQGEQNANCGGPTQTANSTYSTMLQAMVNEWRANLQQTNLVFGAVLLAPWKANSDLYSFPLLRLAQANLTSATSSAMANSFVVNNLDMGDYSNPEVHSPLKQADGLRAAHGIAALTKLVLTAQYLAPTYSGAKLENASASSSGGVGASGQDVTVLFDEATLYGGFVVNASREACPPSVPVAQCEGFAVMTADCTWHVARATVHNDSSTITLSNLSSSNAAAGGTSVYRLLYIYCLLMSTFDSIFITNRDHRHSRLLCELASCEHFQRCGNSIKPMARLR